MKRKAMNMSLGERVFVTANALLLTVFFVILLYPLVYVLSASFSDPNAVYTGKMLLFPVGFSVDGYEFVMDGTNASDDASDRPGMQVLRELHVLSPLQACGITKQEVRRLSKEAGLFTWNKPAYACLATRIATGEEISLEKLQTTEYCENVLTSMGFSDFRIRLSHGTAKMQLQESQLEKLLAQRMEILEKLKPYYASITLDLEVRS